MLNYMLRIIVFAAGWLLITQTSSADAPHFLPPAERVQLEQNKPWPANHFLVLAYHDVEDKVADQRSLSVQTSARDDQTVWLRDNGYQPVSVQQIPDAHNGGTPLPPKAVLISFNEGYRSLYNAVWSPL